MTTSAKKTDDNDNDDKPILTLYDLPAFCIVLSLWAITTTVRPDKGKERN